MWVKHRLMKGDMKHWSTRWPLIRFHLNSLPRARNDNLSAAEVVYGRPFYLPYMADDCSIPNTPQEWTKHASSYFSNLYPQLLNFQRARYEKTIEQDKGVKINLEIGSYCLFYKPTLFNKKYVSAWSEPCRIYKKVSTNTYEIRDKAGRSFIRHLRNIRPINFEVDQAKQYPDPTQNSNEIDSNELENDLDINMLYTSEGSELF